VTIGGPGTIVLRHQLVEECFPDELEQRPKPTPVAFAQAQVDADRFGTEQVGRSKSEPTKGSHHPLGQERPGPRYHRLPAASQKAASQQVDVDPAIFEQYIERDNTIFEHLDELPVSSASDLRLAAAPHPPQELLPPAVASDRSAADRS
jgi:hypothetical protein